MSRLNLALLLTAVLVSMLCAGRSANNPHARYVADGFELIDQYALDRPADDELVAGAMRGMVDVLRRRGDEHSGFLRKHAARQYRDELSGGFGGVGVRVGMVGQPPTPTVVGPPEPGTPAFDGGVKPDDRIIAIDGKPTAGLSMTDIIGRMRGEVGQPVALTLSRGAPPQEVVVELERAKIEVPTVLGDRRLTDGSWEHLLDQDRRIALVRIETFGDRTYEELSTLIPQLQAEGMRAMVLDLRNNPGGALDVAIDCCDLFLPPGAPIVETRGRTGELLERFISEGGPYQALPLAVILDGGSASASEIMAACLQDNGRAVVVGARSFGKGTVQRLLDMEDGQTMLKLTIASFWRPSGVDIHRRPGIGEDAPWGVRPDAEYAVPLSSDEIVAFFASRSARDVLPIDAPEDEAAQVDAPEIAAADERASEQHASERDAAEPFVDRMLDRAVEHLQSLLDASAGKSSPGSPA